MSHGFSKMLSYILFSTFFISSALGHMQLEKPYPLRSPLNPAKSGLIDYDMTAPLAADGSNFPCKGYHRDSGVQPVETYTAGQTYSIKIAGSASHGGGSCQIVLSHDNGSSWKVVKSMIGGCPLKSTYDFKMPQNVKNGDNVLFGWTWINRVGNREFYMNCARVKITGGSGTWNPPDMFTANLGGSCITPEGLDVVFPNPGDQVEYGGEYASNPPSGPSNIQGCTQGSAPPPPSSDDTPVTTEENTYPEPTEPAQTEPAQTEPAQTEPATTEPAPTEPVPTTIAPQPTACEPNTIVQTVTQTHTEIQYVTVTQDRTGKYTRNPRPTTTQQDTYETPAPESCDQSQAEQIQCYDGGKKWKFCDGTEWVDMKECSQGQICKNGQLVDLEY